VDDPSSVLSDERGKVKQMGKAGSAAIGGLVGAGLGAGIGYLLYTQDVPGSIPCPVDQICPQCGEPLDCEDYGNNQYLCECTNIICNYHCYDVPLPWGVCQLLYILPSAALFGIIGVIAGAMFGKSNN